MDNCLLRVCDGEMKSLCWSIKYRPLLESRHKTPLNLRWPLCLLAAIGVMPLVGRVGAAARVLLIRICDDPLTADPEIDKHCQELSACNELRIGIG